MKKNGLTEDRMMKNLCDDIVVVYRTLGTEYGFMYSCARQHSNGAERSHNASDTPRAPRAQRQRHARFRNFSGLHMRQCSVMPAEDACEEDNDNKYSLSGSSNEDNVFGFTDEKELDQRSDSEEDEFEKLINEHEMSPTYCSQDVNKVINSLNEEEDA
jgi:hypothetical protein